MHATALFFSVLFLGLWIAPGHADHPGDKPPSPFVDRALLSQFYSVNADPLEIVYCHNWILTVRRMHRAGSDWRSPLDNGMTFYVEIRKTQIEQTDGYGDGEQMHYAPLRTLPICNSLFCDRDTSFTLSTVLGGEDSFRIWWHAGSYYPNVIYSNYDFHFQVRAPFDFGSDEDPRTLLIHYAYLADTTQPRAINVYYNPKYNALPLPRPPFQTISTDLRMAFDGFELAAASPADLASMEAETNVRFRPSLSHPRPPVYRIVRHRPSFSEQVGAALAGLVLFALFDIPEAPVVSGETALVETVEGAAVAEGIEGATLSRLKAGTLGTLATIEATPLHIAGTSFRLNGMFEPGSGMYAVDNVGVVREASGIAAGRIVGFIESDGAIYEAAPLGRGLKIGQIEGDGKIVQTSGSRPVVRGRISTGGIITGPTGQILGHRRSK